MAYNHEYPYSDAQLFNDDWLIMKVKEVMKVLDDFVNLNKIKYANPIIWNIESQYELNTVVIDGQTGDAYISVKPVPAGVLLSREEYWTPIYNYSLALHVLRTQIAAADEQLSNVATENRSVGDLVWLNGLLYKVISDMNVGDLYVVDTNIEKTTVETELNLIVSIFNSKIGNLDELKTNSKSSVVEALNEVVDTKLSNANIYNIVDYGAVGDGLEDCSDAIEDAIEDATTNGGLVYIPAGNYNITRTINIAFNKPFSIMGVGDSSVLLHSTDNTIFNFTTRANLMSVKDLRITSTNTAKTTASAFYFNLGCYRILFENVRYDLDNENAVNMHFPYSFFNCPDNVNTDTVAFINCYMEHIDGPAYKVGVGSSIWITGGRIVGTGYDLGRPNSIGLKCNGGMGGVYITSVDFIKLRVGIQISNSISDSNREFFIVNSTFDGDDLGFYITDGDAGTYIEITGCWICTSNNLGIYSVTGARPNVKISNSTISLIGLSAAAPTDSVGLSINGGTWTVDNCRFWHDLGKAIYVNLSGAGDYGIFKNNVFHDNYKDADIQGYVTFSDNLLAGNSGITRYDNDSIVERNQGQTPVVTPTLPAAGVGITNETGRHVLISLTGTNIQGIYLNNVLQIANAGSVIAAPKDAISIAYTGTNLVWKWFDL